MTALFEASIIKDESDNEKEEHLVNFTVVKKLVRLVDNCPLAELRHRIIRYLQCRIVMVNLEIGIYPRQFGISGCCNPEVANNE